MKEYSLPWQLVAVSQGYYSSMGRDGASPGGLLRSAVWHCVFRVCHWGLREAYRGAPRLLDEGPRNDQGTRYSVTTSRSHGCAPCTTTKSCCQLFFPLFRCGVGPMPFVVYSAFLVSSFPVNFSSALVTSLLVFPPATYSPRFKLTSNFSLGFPFFVCLPLLFAMFVWQSLFIRSLCMSCTS